MRNGLTILLMVAILFGGTYWYFASAVCDVPISYRLGTVDPRFNITDDEAKNALFVAESMWEDATGRNLFTYDERADVLVNFVYDDRQEYANAEEELREALEAKEGMSDNVRSLYDALLKQYSTLKKTYEARVKTYDSKLAEYNKEVSDWNDRGGAPADVYERLSTTKETLASEQTKLNGMVSQLNALVKKMNTVGEQGNSLITDYNQTVNEYNNTFIDEREFTQGEYTNDPRAISIFEFQTREELELVLAHEFGHALSLNHVDDPEGIMYHLMEKQSTDIGVTPADVQEFTAVCGNENNNFRLFRFIWNIFHKES